MLASVVALAACTGDDASSPPASTSTVSSTAAVPARPAAAIARDALLAASDTPEGWARAKAEPLDDLSGVCLEVQAERDRAERRGGSAPVSAAARLAAPVGLPAVRVEASVYESAHAAEIAYDQRAGERSALCAARAVDSALAATSGVVVADAAVRPARAGRLGDEAKSWIVSDRVERNGVVIDLRVERVTIRVDRLIGTVVIASSPEFAFAGEQREHLLGAAAKRAVAALVAP